MTDGHARRLLALVAPSMVDGDHKRARLLLLRTDWADAAHAAEATEALAELTGVPRTIWDNALRDQTHRRIA